MAIQKATGQVIGDLEVHNVNIAPSAVTPDKLHTDITVYDSSGVTSIVDSAYVQSLQLTYNTSNFADSAFVTSQINNLIDGAPQALNTLNELAAALNDDSNAYNTLLTQINALLDSSEITALIDSDYVLNRVQNNATVDDATALAIALG
jgi:hypothetical protein